MYERCSIFPSASLSWFSGLFLYLSLIFSSSFWNFFFKPFFRNFLNFVMSVIHLIQKVKSHNSLFTECLPSSSLRQKQHEYHLLLNITISIYLVLRRDMNSCPPPRQLLITFLLRCRGEKTITKQCANCPQQGREKQANPIDTKENSVMVSAC